MPHLILIVIVRAYLSQRNYQQNMPLNRPLPISSICIFLISIEKAVFDVCKYFQIYFQTIRKIQISFNKKQQSKSSDIKVKMEDAQYLSTMCQMQGAHMLFVSFFTHARFYIDKLVNWDKLILQRSRFCNKTT